MKRLLLTFLAFLAVIAMNAEQVSKQDALRKAQQFMPDKQFKETASSARARSGKSDENEAFYIFNAEDKKGFVIVSGDDRTEPILGYSDTGCIDLDNLPPNLKGWLEGYSKQIKALETSGYSRSKANARAATRTTKAAVEPLITTKWGQDGPYNLMCPEIDGKHCVTGCVATAMAQVMYYHKWPQDACAAIPAYTTSTRQIQMDALTPTTFNWSAMKSKYWDGEQGESADAVAELMRYCGQAVEMGYDINESGALEAPWHFMKYFGYSKNAKTVSMSQYTITQWEDILYKELSEGRPIIYWGASLVTAHDFICDGYDGNGYYHFNWGWNGLANGHFLLSLMYNEAIGFGFVEDQAAIIGLEPEKGKTVTPYVYGYDSAELIKTNYSRASAIEDFTNITLNGGIYIQYEVDVPQDVTLDYGLGLYQDNQLLTVLNQSSATFNLDNKAVANEMSVSFGKDLSDGTYQIQHIYKYPNSDIWEVCYDTYLNNIVATISGNSLTLKKTTISGVQDADYVVNNVSFSGRKLTIVTVNLTNIGTTNQELLFFCNKSDGTIWNCAMVCGSIAPGETGDVVFPYVFPYSGDNTMLISTKPGGQNVKWEKVVNIPEPVGQHLTCASYSIKNFENEILNDSKLHFTFTITNDGEETYDDGIGYVLQEYTDNNTGALIRNQITQMLTLNKGESRTIEMTIPNLKNNTYYSIDLYASNINLFSSPITFFVASQIFSYDDLNYAYDPTIKTASVIAGDYQQLEAVTIPNIISVDGESYKVTEIAPKAFADCYFKSVILQEGLESLGSYAFSGSEVKSITLPSTLKHISACAFYLSSGIKEISLPEGIGSIGYAAFRDCRDLEVLRLPSTLKSLDYDVICGINLKSVYSAMADPIKVAENTFASYYDEGRPIQSSATLYVPKGSVEKYQAASGWNIFPRITDKLPYKLTYYVDGEIYKEYVIEEETSITPEPAPTKETYVFSGWSEIPETMPDHDVIITGTFERHFDVGHVVNVVNFIMGNNATPEDIALYDMNNDNELNIGDIILVLKSILNSGGGGSNLARSRTENSVDLAQYTAAQFILSVADGTSVKDIHLVKSMEGSHRIMYSKKGANTYYVVVYSLSNELMKPENDNIIVVETDGGNHTSFTMRDMIVALQNGETERYQGHYVGTTGIREFENEETPAIIYDLKGNRIDGGKGLKNGLYIINGKKVVVK